MEGKRKKKYPNIGADYEAKNVSGLYFVGTISHGVDLRESAGKHGHSAETSHRPNKSWDGFSGLIIQLHPRTNKFV
jgi:hypothetical protein